VHPRALQFAGQEGESWRLHDAYKRYHEEKALVLFALSRTWFVDDFGGNDRVLKGLEKFEATKDESF
jgi:hypothetical protein